MHHSPKKIASELNSGEMSWDREMPMKPNHFRGCPGSGATAERTRSETAASDRTRWRNAGEDPNVAVADLYQSLFLSPDKSDYRTSRGFGSPLAPSVVQDPPITERDWCTEP
jgi:hypothetical protein